jgi:acetyl-CoA acetyltransferase
MTNSRSAAIVGVGSTKYYRRGQSLPRTPMELAGQAVLAALADAGLSATDVDGFAFYAGGLDTALLAQTIGVPEVNFVATLTGGGGGAAGGVALAASAISSGQADVVVTVQVLQQSGYRLGRGDATTGPYAKSPTPERDFLVPFGMVSPAYKFAMVAARHMHLYGTRREHFAEVAISTRANAMRRQTSIMRDELTLDAYFNARVIAEPLCLFDFCLETDGAVAVVTTTAERARDLRQPPAHIAAAAFGGEGRYGTHVSWANAPDEYLATSFHRQTARQLWARSGYKPSDIDVAEIYDHFTPLVLLQLEDYGFCAVGESGDFVASGAIRWPDGALPMNTHGGNLSEAYILGMTHIREATEQIRGTAVNQVAGARLALVTGGPASLPTSAMILSTEEGSRR